MHQTPDRASAWEAEGRRLAPALDGVAAVVVAGHDLDAAAHLALGIAAAQSAHRRVALADLTGSAAPLQRLVPDDDDPHGLTDTFLYGISLNRVARQLDDDGRLFIVPTGTEPALREDILGSDRWRRVAQGFRDVGALLLLVAPSDATGLASLVAMLDGAVGADHGVATQSLPYLLVSAETPDAALPLAGAPRARPIRFGPATLGGRPLHPALMIAIGLLLVVGLAWAARWVGRPRAADRPLFVNSARTRAGVDNVADSLSSPPGVVPGPTTLAAAAPPGAAIAASGAAGSAAYAAVLNLADTAVAAAYAVEIGVFGNEEQAKATIRAYRTDLLVATIVPVRDGAAGAMRYRVIADARPESGPAEATLARLRRQGVLRASAGRVVHLPYALQLESGVPRDSVRYVLNRLIAQGIPAYALEQSDSRARIYAGAFEEPSDAHALLTTLQAEDIPAALAVRTGRPL